MNRRPALLLALSMVALMGFAASTSGCSRGPGEAQIGADLKEKGLCKGDVTVRKQSETEMGTRIRVIASIDCDAKIMVDPLGESCRNLMGCLGWRKVSDTCTLDYPSSGGGGLGSVSCGQIGRW